MKRILTVFVAISCLSSMAIAAPAPTCTGPVSGMVIGTAAQAATASASTGAGDLYVADEMKVSGAATLAGPNTISGATTVSGVATFAAIPILGMAATDVAVTSPTVAGQLCRTSAYVIYVASGPGTIASWIKIGGQ